MIAAPDGSYWLLCDETRTMDLSAQGESPHARVLGTNVQHRGATGDSCSSGVHSIISKLM